MSFYRSATYAVACALLMQLSDFAAPAGSLNGLVKDPSGAPVPGVRLTLSNVATGARKTAFSATDGAFEFLELDPARWSLVAEAAGFRRATIPDALVEVDRTTRVEMILQVGQASEVVEVSAAMPLLETSRPTLGSIIGKEVLSSVPLNGRQFLDLALFAPGVLPAAPGTQGGGFNASGARSQSNVYLLDGISNQDTQNNQPLNLFRITDAVAEFSVQTSVPPPEFGRGTGGQVNVVTKTGSNTFHGSAFEYLRNTRLDAADFFTNKLGGAKADLHRNQFGGTLGGPIWRDRTFFFASYEAFRQVAPIVSSTRVPTPAERASVTDPIGQRLLAYWPAPNATGALNYISNVRNQDSDDTGLVRIDHRFGERDQINGRWAEYRGWSSVPGPTPLSGGNEGPPAQRSIEWSELHTFSTTLLNDFRMGESRNTQVRTVQDYGLNAAAIFTGPGGNPLPGVVDATRDPLNSGLPTITVAGGYAVLGTNVNFPQGRVSNTVELFDSVSLQASKHTLRWGFHIRREDLRRYLDRASRGAFNFANFADFARGLVNTASIRTGSTLAYWRRYPWDLYWQDEYRISAYLTFNYGVRYEYPSAVGELRNHATNFVPGYGPVIAGTDQILDINPADTGPASLVFRRAPFELPSSGMHSDNSNIAPMFGFAYAPAGHTTVLRGGFRLAYDDLFNNVPSSMALSAPYNIQTTQTANVTQPGKFPWATGFDQSVPLISNLGRQGSGSPTVGILTFQGIDPDLKSARVLQYNLGIQRGLGDSFSIEADYQGSSGRHLGVFIDVNQPLVIVRDSTKRGPVAPNEQVFPYNHYGQAQIAKSIGNSNYNGLLMLAKYRGRRGTFLQASYVYGKSLDYNSSYYGSGNLPGETGAPADSTNLRIEHGPSAFDLRHRFEAVYVVDLPTGTHAHWLLGGWQISGVSTLQSGYPFTVVNGGPDTSGFNQSNPGTSPSGGNRPDVVRPGPLPQDNANPDAAFNTAWFATAGAGRVGTSGRNAYYGPGLMNYDFALLKSFVLPASRSETSRIQFRADFFNLLNHTNFANPIADMNNANFGKITQTLGSAVATSVGTTGGATGGPRLIQLAVRVQF